MIVITIDYQRLSTIINDYQRLSTINSIKMALSVAPGDEFKSIDGCYIFINNRPQTVRVSSSNLHYGTFSLVPLGYIAQFNEGTWDQDRPIFITVRDSHGDILDSRRYIPGGTWNYK